MAFSKREFLRALWSLSLACLPALGKAKSVTADPSSPLTQAIAQATAGQHPEPSEAVQLETPDIAEDGAIVPVTIRSELPQVDTIWVFVEKNPVPLAARFDLGPGLDAFVSLRIKLNESCRVLAVVRSEGGFYRAEKPVRVVLGGCG